MPGQKPEIDGTSVILVGQFNPVIFQPAWLAAQKLIRPEEADAALIEMIHPSVTRFSTEWFTLEVSQARFVAESANPACFEMLRDLVSGIFTVLEHTPFSQMGLNGSMHFSLPSAERWHALGDLLAPKAPWTDVLESPGLRSVMLLGKRAKSSAKRIFVTVEPSLRITPHGLFVSVNEHFEGEPGLESARELLQTLASEWTSAREYATHVGQHLVAWDEGI